MRELDLKKLEQAIEGRYPLLIKRLFPGLLVGTIEKKLKNVGIDAEFDPIVLLYSWKNGSSAAFDNKKGFFPNHNYGLMNFDLAVACYKMFKEWVRDRPDRPELVNILGKFTIFQGWHKYIAVDLDPTRKNRVMLIDTDLKQPCLELYSSFDDFMADVIQANRDNVELRCFSKALPTNYPLANSGFNEMPVADQAPQHQDSSTSTIEANTKLIPKTENTLVLRTDFSNESAWKSLCAVIQNPDDEFVANVDFVSDPKFDGLIADKVPSLLPEDSSLTFAFIVDHTTLSNPDHPILVIDLYDNPGRTFRVVASEIGSVENNLSIANMGFDEFADAVDKDGIFRGF